ncbi:thiamine-phosphate kinase [uncultured Thiothrix sp.]|uniref:thiamine-phosphate kinase n=1 Tax=uncultured Thiothrix sp. TaxID=223185 RepID=UPI0026026FDD|nr:thiamine-phosphate kinase [uncultured Thiothrix sp.]
MHEFDLIQQYFTWTPAPKEVRVSVGDDAAIVQVAPNEELIISVDTLVNGVHFPLDTPAHAIGYKALAVNLSDLAAMGARPRWFTLALTLPKVDQSWLEEFSRGLKALASQAGIFLIGGDTTRGPLSMTIQVMGTAPKQQALLRSGAQVGDLIFVSGHLGDAAAGLAVAQERLSLANEDAKYCINRLNYPTPRIDLGTWLRGRASSCMDISDGLVADLKHLLKRSQVGAKLYHQQIPLSPALQKLNLSTALSFALTGGDDYELLFTAPKSFLAEIENYQSTSPLALSCIGEITSKIAELSIDYELVNLPDGYNHFQ